MPASGAARRGGDAAGSSTLGSSGLLGSSVADHPTSRVPCVRKSTDVPYVTPREVDLQQQRYCALEAGRPPGGYLAACTIVRGALSVLFAGSWDRDCGGES
jgi:hypothetical protein